MAEQSAEQQQQSQAIDQAPETPAPEVLVPLSVPLGSVRTARSAAEIVKTLDTAARRGRLAGFEPNSRGNSECFRAAAFGTPFDGVLIGRLAEGSLRFETRLRPLMPMGFALVLAASVWPGVVLTESMIASFFPSSSAWKWTWWWYIPLTLPFCPWVFWSAVKKSRATVHDSAHQVIAKIAAELGGKVEPAATKPTQSKA